jgi:acyl-CoA reductase-like NAD-dependent aldehyde dehydrogenase
VHDAKGAFVANAVLGSRKDLRDAVRAARGAQAGWRGRSAYNRGQVLYRVAEIMQGRRTQFVEELDRCGSHSPEREVEMAIDRWVWYAGWSDKFAQVLGAANPVDGPYFDFTVPEPMGVVGIVCPDDAPLLALVSRLAPCIVSGNTAVVLASERRPLVAITLAETLATSDVPAGVVDILTGRRAEIVPWLAGHADVDCVDLTGCEPSLRTVAERAAADSVMRVVAASEPERRWTSDTAQSPYVVGDFVEYKTVWHAKGI